MQISDEQIVTENESAPETAQTGKRSKKEKKPVDVKKEVISWIITLGSAVLIALVIRTFIFEPIRVDGQSMCDTLQDGEVMYVSKPEYLFGDPQFGDVVICKYPDMQHPEKLRPENFVKRVIGTPGDVIEVINNVVYRNGEALEEPYLTPSRNKNGFSMAAFELGEKEYFVMGDNRDNSHDSRNYFRYGVPTAITRDMIKGHVRFVFFPFNVIRGIE